MLKERKSKENRKNKENRIEVFYWRRNLMSIKDYEIGM